MIVLNKNGGKMYILPMILSSFLMYSSLLLAQDDLEESPGLQNSTDSENEKKTGLDQVSLTPISEHNYRAYLDLNSSQSRLFDHSLKKSTTAEASLSFNYIMTKHFEFFLDGIAQNRSFEIHQFAYLNTGGWRWRLGNFYSFTIGKERNRVSPGMIVSPSDLLHSQQSIPGLNEDRSGEWISRASYNESTFSLDMIYLITDHQKDNGMLDLDLGKPAWIFRGTMRLGIELGFNYALKDDSHQFGLFYQDLITKNIKLYGEYGNVDFKKSSLENDFKSYLLGLSYEGFKDISLASEYYQNGAGLTKTEWQNFYDFSKIGTVKNIKQHGLKNDKQLFIRRDYLISSLQLFPQQKDWQWTTSWIRSLEDQGNILVNKLKYDLFSYQHIAFQYMRVLSPQNSAYQFAPQKWQAQLSWRNNF